MKRLNVILIGLAVIILPAPARAQATEVAPGISVSRKTYRVPANEAPFFDFSAKNQAQKEADRKFISDFLERFPEGSQAAGMAIDAGMKAFLEQNDAATAAKRFNQAYLLDPQESGIYHGFALIVATRFNDLDYADELFRLAARMKAPAPPLRADHGRMLLIAGRPAEAKPLLQQAVKDNPDWATARMNLAWATLLSGDREEACRLISQVRGRGMEGAAHDLALFKQKVAC